MKKVFVSSHNIITPLGFSSHDNFDNIIQGKTAVKEHIKPAFDESPFYASLFENAYQKTFKDKIPSEGEFTNFENLLAGSISFAAVHSRVDLASSKTIFIFATTKGNIDLLEQHKPSEQLFDRMNLFKSAQIVTSFFKNPNRPILVSNACISGVLAILQAHRLLRKGIYENAVVCGGDLIGKFVYSGFKSFQALSPGQCKPFSSDRDGINLGEGAGTIIFSSSEQNTVSGIEVRGGSSSNDANHISGPSRTGEELAMAIEKALVLSGLNPSEIGFVSAHGTATSFNDEMEAKAFHLSGLANTPLNSLKGYFGHTLGAAGIIESIVGLLSLEYNKLVPTSGFVGPVLEPQVNVCKEISNLPLKSFLKTASGFGGCNAAVIFSKP